MSHNEYPIQENCRVLPKPIALPVSILFPVCNEEDVIEDVINEWLQDVFCYLPEGSEMIFDDASTDRTNTILQKLADIHPFIKVYHQEEKDGFFNSAVRLYRSAKCPLIFFTDSDGQYVPSEFWKLVPFIEEYDVIHGAKLERKDAIHRIIASFYFNKFAKSIFGFYYPDINSAYRLMKATVIDELLPKVKHMPTLINAELLLRANIEGYKIKSVGVVHRSRQVGISRGLPWFSFLNESCRAFNGLLRIKQEYSEKNKV